jgi:hypothetical protein
MAAWGHEGRATDPRGDGLQARDREELDRFKYGVFLTIRSAKSVTTPAAQPTKVAGPQSVELLSAVHSQNSSAILPRFLAFARVCPSQSTSSDQTAVSRWSFRLFGLGDCARISRAIHDLDRRTPSAFGHGTGGDGELLSAYGARSGECAPSRDCFPSWENDWILAVHECKLILRDVPRNLA